jgi:hypothetical protein
MTKQDLQQIIKDLSQLVNNINGNYVNENDVLKALRNDDLRITILNELIRNNMPYTLCRISSEIVSLVHRIYELEDYDDSEEKYLNKTLRALDGFKAEIQRIQEYTNLLNQVNILEHNMTRYKEGILEGVRMYDYKCSLDNIKY